VNLPFLGKHPLPEPHKELAEWIQSSAPFLSPERLFVLAVAQGNDPGIVELRIKEATDDTRRSG
jgi:hypothetical protein